MAGTAYRELLQETFGLNGELVRSGVQLVRFDTSAAHVVALGPGGEEPWPDPDFDCRLDAPFGDSCGTDDAVYVQQGGFGTPSGLDGDKTFQSLIPAVTYQRAVGVIYEGGSAFGGAWRQLTWARVGGIEYGQAALSRESPSESGTLGVRIWPNAARGATTVELRTAQPGPARAEVFDALGRRVAVVWDGPLGAGRTPVSFDAGRLAAGVYVVRLAAGGAWATETLRVAR